MIYYPTVADVLRPHSKIIATTSGPGGVRDVGLLESSLGRPLATFHGVEFYPSLWEKAAALMHGIARNHPFVDGNKRTGMALGVVFLLVNGYRLEVTQDEFERTGLALAAGHIEVADLAVWLEENSLGA